MPHPLVTNHMCAQLLPLESGELEEVSPRKIIKFRPRKIRLMPKSSPAVSGDVLAILIEYCLDGTVSTTSKSEQL